MKNKTISITEARKEIFKIADEVQNLETYYTLTDRGRSKMVVMSAEEFDSWKETLEVKKMFPDLNKDINEVRRDYKKGNYITLEEMLAKEGFVLADSGKNKYEISNNFNKKNSKRSRKNR